MLIGTMINEPTQPFLVDKEGLLHHTIIVGQSGSGKSFFLARLIEEILLRTKARIVVVDPNGDYRRLHAVSDDAWAQHELQFLSLNEISQKEGISAVESKREFARLWSELHMTYLYARDVPRSIVGRVIADRLWIHWASLQEERDFLLNVDAKTQPSILLGIKACQENLEWFTERNTALGRDLIGLQSVATRFANQEINLADYDFAKGLDRSDWYAVRAHFIDLRRRFKLWWSQPPTRLRRPAPAPPPGLCDFLQLPYDQSTREDPAIWRAITIGLDSAEPADALLAANTALWRLWRSVKALWLEAMDGEEKPSPGRPRMRPTFVVIDEAHNFAPKETSDPLRRRVTERLLQIASEGRKYGLYLILATQRPTKLHPELVAECENTCLLRVQSSIERDFAADVLGVSKQRAGNVPRYRKGQGLFAGRWTESNEYEIQIAPARTVVGGGGVDPDWDTPAEPVLVPGVESYPLLPGMPRGATGSGLAPLNLNDDVRHFVVDTVRQSDGPVSLAQLAQRVQEEFSIRETGWLGFGQFKRLAEEINARETDAPLAFSDVGPGYMYDRARHRAPTDHPVFVSGGAPETERLAVRINRELNVPLLNSEQYATLFRKISAEIGGGKGFVLSAASRAVRDAMKAAAVPVPRATVNFVLKGLYFAGYDFGSDVPTDPPYLAEVFANNVIDLCKDSELQLSRDEEDLIGGWIQGGFKEETGTASKPGVSLDAAAADPRSDGHSDPEVS